MRNNAVRINHCSDIDVVVLGLPAQCQHKILVITGDMKYPPGKNG